MALRPAPRRFTVDDYLRLELAGLLTEDDRVELIEGELIDMAALGSPHASIVGRLTQHFSVVPRELAIVWVQNPIRLSDVSQPQPDLTLLRPRSDFYSRMHPRPADVLLLIEVSDSSVGYDRQIKAPLYARSGVRELWIVDLASRLVEVHLGPTAEGYVDVQEWHPGSSVVAQAFPGNQLDVAALFASV